MPVNVSCHSNMAQVHQVCPDVLYSSKQGYIQAFMHVLLHVRFTSSA